MWKSVKHKQMIEKINKMLVTKIKLSISGMKEETLLQSLQALKNKAIL